MILFCRNWYHVSGIIMVLVALIVTLCLDSQISRFLKVGGKSICYYHVHGSLVFGGCSSCDDLHQLACNDSLTRSVEEDLEFGDHLTSVLGSILRDTTLAKRHGL